MASDLYLAYDHCRQIAKVSARNFYYAFRTLPGRQRRAVHATYAFCRTCDDIADDDLPLEDKERLFAHVREMLVQSRNGTADDPIFVALRDAAETYSIPAHYFEEVIQGVELDLTQSRFETFDELRAYCYKVASAVGLICIEVFGYTDPTAREYAVDLGIAMQLTNIMRDLREDADRSRIYLPRDELAKFGYSEDELFAGVVNDPFRRLMQFQADRARRYFASGRRLIPLLSPRSRACVRVLHDLYSRILDRIESADFDVFKERISLGDREKLFLMAKLWALSLIPITLPLRR